MDHIRKVLRHSHQWISLKETISERNNKLSKYFKPKWHKEFVKSKDNIYGKRIKIYQCATI